MQIEAFADNGRTWTVSYVVQVSINAGNLPEPENNDVAYLKVALNCL